MPQSWFMKPRRGGKVIAAGLTERPVQRGAIRLLAMQRIEAVHVANGSHLAGDKLARAKQMAALRKDGLRPGFPDLILFGRQQLQIGFIEVKREIGNDLSDEQEGWRDMLTAWGFPWAMIRTPEQALDVVRQWGWIK